MKKGKHRRTAEKNVESARVSGDGTATLKLAHFQFARWHYAAAILLFTLVAFQVYGPALHGEFLFDDSYLPFLVPDVQQAPLRAWLGVRPVLMLSFWLNYQQSALNPYPYHLVNVLLHVLNSALVWIIVRRYLAWINEKGEYNQMLSIFAGLLFLLHPAQTESVAYVASRSETMSIFFFLSALAVYIYRKTDAVGWPRAIAAIALFGVACTVKEHTVVLPLFLALTDYYFMTPFRFEAIRRNWRLYLPIIGIGAIGILGVIRVLQASPTAGFRVTEFTWYQYLFTQFRSIWLYLRLYVLPFGQNGDYDMPISRTILDNGAIFGFLALAALAALAWRFRLEFPLTSFGYFGFLLLLAPTSSIIPIRDVAAERRLYLPFICLLLITVDLLRRWKFSKMALVGAMSAVLFVASVLSYQRNHVWSSALAFWKDATAKSPHNSRAWFQLAYAQWIAGQCGESVKTYERVSTLMSPREDLLIDWAYALECAGRPDEAIAKLRQAAQATPSAHVFATIGMMHGKRGNTKEALDALASAQMLNPRFEMTFVYRGNVFLSAGEPSAAINEFNRALEINPRNDAARDGLRVAQSQLTRPPR